MLPAIADTILPAYLAGLAADGFLYDLIGSESPADRRAFDERVALARFLVDHYRAVHPG